MRKIAQFLIALVVVLAGITLRRAVEAIAPRCADDAGFACADQLPVTDASTTDDSSTDSNLNLISVAGSSPIPLPPPGSLVAIGSSPVPLPPPGSLLAIGSSPVPLPPPGSLLAA